MKKQPKKVVKKTTPKPKQKVKPATTPKPIITDRAAKIALFNARADKAEAAATKLEARAAKSRARAGRVRAHAVKYANGGSRAPSPAVVPLIELPKGDAPGQVRIPEVEAAVASCAAPSGEDLL